MPPRSSHGRRRRAWTGLLAALATVTSTAALGFATNLASSESILSAAWARRPVPVLVLFGVSLAAVLGFTLSPVTYPQRGRPYSALHMTDDLGQGNEYLRRIAEAVERIADKVAGPAAVQEPNALPTYPIIDSDDAHPESERPEPHIQRWANQLYYAVCTYCPADPGQVADPCDRSTWLEYEESSYDLDEQRAALTRHLAHHRKQADPTAALPIWTWSDHGCPRCQAPSEHKCRTRSGRPSTAVHAARRQDRSREYW
ncbi:hypothetical protein ABGB16_31085 [Micromonospora sp. B11E3]|uniref:hypothetical protein n=1 Tax=Micromonospora sp. B11E3 TaxID=3153562 RepID=UPI00325D34A8